jgi:outer membrane protein OmpA-like peptidoglycan-associated protein
MPLSQIRFRSFARVLAPALVASLLPMGTAYAQSASRVRVTRDGTEVNGIRGTDHTLLLTAAEGTVLEVMHTQGDKFANRDSNWYWVLVPPDTWGVQRHGWISGRDVELLPPVERAKAAPVDDPRIAQLQRELAQARADLEKARAVTTAPVAAAATPMATNVAETTVSELILNFDFAKSTLTDEARTKLADAMGKIKGGGQTLSIALEGHADWVGPEAYNEKLGLARAETVKKYLADQHQVAVDKISVVSYGENQPAASNATTEGRAQNRRVVIKVGSDAAAGTPAVGSK